MQAIVSVHCFVPPDLNYPKDINDQIVKYLMIACYLPKKQSLLLPKIIIFISALHAFTLFLKPKPHTSSNVVANVRQVWVLGNWLENMTITTLLVVLTLSFHRCLMIED